MKTVIYKYTVDKDVNEIELPIGATVISFQAQLDKPTIWVRLDTTETIKEKRVFVNLVTGQKFKDSELGYIGTCQLHEGEFVVHLFEHFNARKTL